MLNYDEYNQVLAEKYEERIDKYGQRVALKYDFIPQQDFYIMNKLTCERSESSAAPCWAQTINEDED
jgi:hypothetical protein